MIGTTPQYPVRPPRRALATNHSGGFTSIIPRYDPPVLDGTIDLVGEGGVNAASEMKVWPIGLGANNDAFTTRIYGWSKAVSLSTPRPLWIPSLIAAIGSIMGNSTGLAGAVVLNTEFFCDTLTIIAGGEATITADTTRAGSIYLYSPLNDLVGFAIVPVAGFDYVTFDFDDTTNSPTMNALYALLGDGC